MSNFGGSYRQSLRKQVKLRDLENTIKDRNENMLYKYEEVLSKVLV